MTLSISAALVALWLAYAVSPFVAAYRLVGAVADRDAAALSAGVDFRALRASLGEQIARTYLRITGKAGAPGSLRDQLAQQLAVGVAASIADQILVDLVSPQGLLDFLRTGAPPDVEPDGLPTPAGLSPQALGNVWRAYLNSELGIARFFLDVPVDKPRQENSPAPILPARLGLEAVRHRAAGGLAASHGAGAGEAGIVSPPRLRRSAPATDPRGDNSPVLREAE